jgi:hypothetical protein
MFFPGSNITMFYVLYPFVNYLLALPRSQSVDRLVGWLVAQIMASNYN